MALVDIKVGKRRKQNVEFVVVGDEGKGTKLGDVRWIWWDRHKTPSIIEVTYADKKERTKVSRIQLAPRYEARGWRLLRDMFAEDPDVSQFWDDYVRFAKAQIENPIGMAGKDFPARMLPKALLELRSQGKMAKADRTEFTFSDGSTLSPQPKADEPKADAPAKRSQSTAKKPVSKDE